jgi:hypothetical protein
MTDTIDTLKSLGWRINGVAYIKEKTDKQTETNEKITKRIIPADAVFFVRCEDNENKYWILTKDLI